MNSGSSDGSTNSSVSASKKVTQHRQVNFKLDIKAEPTDSQQTQQVGMQKVPSISDLSEADSSVDIPCNQVSPKLSPILFRV